MDSHKAWQTTVGHEITHVFEGTEFYNELRTAVQEYARRAGTLGKMTERIKSLYSNIENADLDAELTAELIGEYLFTDEAFVKKLSTEHRNVFQKIYEEIKYLAKVVTAGSKEARQLEKVKHIFDKMYRESEVQKNTVKDGEVKYKLSYTTDNKAVAVIESDIFGGKFNELSDSERVKIVKKAIKEFRPYIPVSGHLIGVTSKTAEHFANSDYTDQLRNHDPKLYEDKLNLAQNIDDVIYASTDYINEDLKHPRRDNIIQFARGKVLLDIAGNQYEADVLVGYTSMKETVLYDVQDLKPTSFNIKVKRAQPTLAGNQSDTRTTVVPSDTIISQPPPNVNTQKSLSPLGDDFPIRPDLRGTPASELRYEPAPVNEAVETPHQYSSSRTLF